MPLGVDPGEDGLKKARRKVDLEKGHFEGYFSNA
jgi:hypothetical protein